MSKEMPCGHTWSDFVSIDVDGDSFLCGICDPIGKRVAQLLAERGAFKLLLELSTKPVDATQEEIIKAHKIVDAFFSALKDTEKDLSASEAVEQIGKLPGVQESLKAKEEVNLNKHIKRLMEYGPTRVVINSEGDAVTPERAKRDHDIEPDVIFIRDDGWSLGAPDHLMAIARRMWADEWIGSFRPQDYVESE